jgi:hypothetical protein
MKARIHASRAVASTSIWLEIANSQPVTTEVSNDSKQSPTGTARTQTQEADEKMRAQIRDTRNVTETTVLHFFTISTFIKLD